MSENIITFIIFIIFGAVCGVGGYLGGKSKVYKDEAGKLADLCDDICLIYDEVRDKLDEKCDEN